MGLRPVRIWVPDIRSPAFAEVRHQCAVIRLRLEPSQAADLAQVSWIAVDKITTVAAAASANHLVVSSGQTCTV